MTLSVFPKRATTGVDYNVIINAAKNRELFCERKGLRL